MAVNANSKIDPAVTLSVPLVADNKGASSQDLLFLLRNALYGNDLPQIGNLIYRVTLLGARILSPTIP